jgi:F-type H+-transporting ATPase subunit a
VSEVTITPDQIVYWQSGPFELNATIIFTWLTMALLVGGAWLITRQLRPDTMLSGWQNMLETIIELILNQIRAISPQSPERYLPFVGTLFLFIVVSNILVIVPGYQPPTGSLSTTAALALCVFAAVPIYGIAQQGLRAYLREYLRPTPLMLPLHLLSELSRTLALAVRLFGNIMSGSTIVAILLSIVPLFFPIVIEVLGLITGVIQAYIFAMLAMIYIAAAISAQDVRKNGGATAEKERSL